MISCDRCGKNIGEPLNSRTYEIHCKQRDHKGYDPGESLYRAIQLCDECIKKVRKAIQTAILNCLENE